MSQQTDINKLIIEHQRRLQKLKEKKAKLGISADPSVDTELEDIEAELEKLQAQFRTSGLSDGDSVQVQPAPKRTLMTETGDSQPISRIFLCHAREDKSQVQELYQKLSRAGYHPWMDKYDLIAGQDWWLEITQIISNSDNLVIVCLSQNSLTKRGVIQREIKEALDVLDEMPQGAIYLIPVRLENCEVPDRLSRLHWVNLFDHDGFEMLERAIDTGIEWRQSQPTVNLYPSGAAQAENSLLNSTNVLRTTSPIEPEMILIPAGKFLMGSNPEKDKHSSRDERPQHELDLPGYYISKTPITNALYAIFVQATNYKQPKHWWKTGRPQIEENNHPVVNVSWHDAVAYCNWLSEMVGQTYRLPTEAEWEKGARGSKDDRIYPWDDQWDSSKCNAEQGDKGGTTPVGTYPKGASPYGLLDMAGNVWEWCSTEEQKPYPYDIEEEEWQAEYLSKDVGRVLRGGSFVNAPPLVRCAVRVSDAPNERDNVIGFRVVS